VDTEVFYWLANYHIWTPPSSTQIDR